MKLIEQYKLEPKMTNRGTTEFPYEVSAEIDGYKFFAVLTEYEYEAYMKERIA